VTSGTAEDTPKCDRRQHAIFARTRSLAHRIHRNDKRDPVKALCAYLNILTRQNQEDLFNSFDDTP
jgi:hypothetical protein